MRGQATVEYIVLLAVALIIAVTIIAFTTDWIPGAALSLKERQARMYWKSMTPLTLEDWKISPTGATFDVKNIGEYKVIIKSFSAGGATSAANPGNYELAPGERKIYTAAAITCVSGALYTLENVSITYDVVGGIKDQIERGDRPLIGRCA